MSFFNKSDSDQSGSASADPFADLLAQFTGHSSADQGAQLLSLIGPTLGAGGEDQPQHQQRLIADILPPPHRDQNDAHQAALLVLAKAFAILVQARLIVAVEVYQTRFEFLYYLSDDGRAAIEQGDAATVIARRVVE